MNRLEMAEKIVKRVPMLAQRDKDEWKEAAQIHAAFVAEYPIGKIPSLELDEYVIGKGAQNRSFCYRIEREMDTLGIILGSTAFKFGVYFGRIRSDPADKYRFRPRWGDTVAEAFSAVKQSIVDLLEAADARDSTAIAENRLSPMFKGKLLFLYHPEEFAPIYARPHLEFFTAKLDLRGPFQCEADMQRALMDYRATWPELLSQPPALFMHFLYDVFGWPPDMKSPEAGERPEPLLDDAIAGAQFITQMPTPSPGTPAKAESPGKADYEREARRLRRFGDRGEALVLAMEMKRLVSAGKPELAAQVKRVSQEDDRAGYDILSFEEDGRKRPNRGQSNLRYES